jgi:hypothetical protein
VSRVGRIDGERRGGGCDQTRLISARRTDDCGGVGLSGWVGWERESGGPVFESGEFVAFCACRLKGYWTLSERSCILFHLARRPKVGTQGLALAFWSSQLEPDACTLRLHLTNTQERVNTTSPPHIVPAAANRFLPAATTHAPPTTALRQPQQLQLQPSPRAPHHPGTSHSHGRRRHGRCAPGQDQDRQGHCCRK